LVKAGIDVTAITGSIGPEGISVDDERVKALKNLTDNQLTSAGLQKIQTEDGKTLIKKVAPEALQLSDEAALDKFKKTFPPTTFSPRERATLDFIAKREGASDPDIVFGGNRYKKRLGLDEKPLTEHTISEVINEIMPKLRQLSKADGFGRRDDGRVVGTSAVGTGQMIEGTLKDNLRALGIPEDQWDQLKFNKDLQERLTLQNFKSSGIGDPNADPSTWNHQRLGAQYESLNRGRGHTGMSQAEASAIANASPERPKNQQDDVSPQEAKQKLAELETQQEQQSLTQTLFDQTQGQQTASAQKTMVISMGTNDWADPSKTYDNTVAAIKAAQAKGYKVVIVPPINAKVGETDITGASAEVRRAAADAGVDLEEVQDWSGTGGYHPSNEEAKRIAAKYPGQTFVGDSIANQIGTFAENGTKVAKDGINTNTILENINSEQVAAPEPTPVSVPQPALVQAGFSDPVTAAQSNVVLPEPEQPQAATTPPLSPVQIPPPSVSSFSTGGTVPMTPGENIAGVNTTTGKVEFMSNDRELYTKDDEGNLRIDPSTIRQEDQKAQMASAEPQRAEQTNQPMQYRPQQPMPVSTPDPNFLETMSSGSMASSPSQLRALNRAKLYSENSSSLVNGHFS
jgi:hypothetical protein